MHRTIQYGCTYVGTRMMVSHMCSPTDMWCVEPQQQGARPAPGLSLAAACPFRVHATRELVATKVLRSHSSPRHLKTHTLYGAGRDTKANLDGSPASNQLRRRQHDRPEKASDKQATQRSGEGQRHHGRAKQGDERVVVSSRARDHPDQCGVRDDGDEGRREGARLEQTRELAEACGGVIAPAWAMYATASMIDTRQSSPPARRSPSRAGGCRCRCKQDRRQINGAQAPGRRQSC